MVFVHNENVFSSEEEKYLIGLITNIKSNHLSFVKEFESKISVYFFGIENTLEPPDFKKIAQKEVSFFLRFIEEKNDQLSTERGTAATYDGFSEFFVLNVLHNLYTVLLQFNSSTSAESLEFIQKIFFRYMKSYLLAYIKEKYKQKNEEHEVLYRSLIKTIEKQKEEIIQKEKELNQQKTDFIINFAHEAKFPATALENQIKIAIEEAGNRPLKSLAPAMHICRGFHELVGNMLDYEKILQGKPLYKHNTIVNISDVIKAKIDLFKNIIKENFLKIESYIESGLYVRISLPALDRILNNIIDNAIKFNRRDGSIIIVSSSNDSSVFINIEDTGYGIPPEKLQHIFKPYYQCSNKKGIMQGIGAGLSLVKSIMDEIGGDIDVESIYQSGTTVKFTFKKEIITKNNKEKMIKDIRLSEPIRRMNLTLKKEIFNKEKETILIVEDSVEYIAYLQQNLPEYNFFYALNGKNALQKIEVMPKPDLIISDIMMDVMDGFEFLSRLREISEMQDIPFIFLTAKETEADRLQGLRLGAVDYIVKPFSIPVLKEKIKSLIRDHDIYSKKEVERMERKILKTIKTEKVTGTNFDILFTRYNLSNREQDIVKLIIKGFGNQDIADTLKISADTVKTYITRIRTKCGIRNNVQLTNLFLT
jgi:signal transduction histidine kinase/DNA-binding NarL/FixJ family response regulator